MATPKRAKRIVIVGGGIAGLMLASQLGRRYRRTGDAEVCLVDKAPVHVWKPMLHTFAAGTANAHEDGVPMLAQAKRAGFTYIPGEFYGLDTARKEIALRIGDLANRPELDHRFAYDIAVIAIGSRANDFGTPGVAEHCYFIDTLWQAEALNQAIREEIVYRSIVGGAINIAIVGGGATGVEFAAETMRLLDAGSAYAHIDLKSKLNITLIDSGDRLLNAFPEEVSQSVALKLTELGVAIRYNARVSGATAEGFSLDDGEQIDATIKVWAAGVKAAAPLNELDSIERARTGQILIRETLQTAADPDVFAIGDCASLVPHGEERALPPTAQVARQQADHLAQSIPDYMSGSDPKPFAFTDMGSLVSLSQYGGYGQVGGDGPAPKIALKGIVAKMAHSFFYRMHQAGLYGPVRTPVIVARDGLNALVKPPIRLD
ncbi:MAG: NAD(P)/FAD-dependent oxidoreductase [Pseudomonadota bacterium]